jgi:hypothetical protein
MSTKFMKDSYEETFNNMGELLDRLKELEDVSTWIRDVALRDIQIHDCTMGRTSRRISEPGNHGTRNGRGYDA